MDQADGAQRLRQYMQQVRERHKILFMENKCTGCGCCVENCMVDLLYIDPATRKVSLNNGYLCVGCYACIENCPNGAVFLDDMYEIDI